MERIRDIQVAEHLELRQQRMPYGAAQATEMTQTSIDSQPHLVFGVGRIDVNVSRSCSHGPLDQVKRGAGMRSGKLRVSRH